MSAEVLPSLSRLMKSGIGKGSLAAALLDVSAAEIALESWMLLCDSETKQMKKWNQNLEMLM